MIQKLKVECGAATVGKISQMMKDIQLSEGIMQDFVNFNNGSNTVGGTEFNIEVLTNGTWPTQESPQLQIPPELKTCAEKFSFWYKSQNSSKTLTWLYSNGQVEMQTLFSAKKYQLIVNVYQACILCLFNKDEEITCAQIKQMCEMGDEKFKPAMMKLCNPKIKVLSKTVPKPQFGDDEKIKVNQNFNSKTIKTNIMPETKITAPKQEETSANEKQIAKERSFVIQAHAVKVMKAQKSYRFQ